MRNFLLILFTFIAIIAAIVFYKFKEYESFKTTTIEFSAPLTVELERGDTWKKVGQKLEKARIVQNGRYFYYMIKESGLTKPVRIGEFEFSGTLTPMQIAQIIVSGKIKLHQFTIPEGYNKYDAAAVIMKQDWIKNHDKFLEYCNDKAFLRKIGGEYFESCEGLLFPSTYRFEKNIELSTVLSRMSDYMFKILEKYKRDIAKTGFSAYEVLKLASIIEKETGVFEEQPKIASVFLNRLKINMRLQSDPTVIYGLMPDYNGDLTRENLLDDNNLYSSYAKNGLPPTPIAFPGENAIKSVLFPEKTKDIYFVATNNGYHYFSKTLDEHNAAVRHYQKKGNSTPFVWKGK